MTVEDPIKCTVTVAGIEIASKEDWDTVLKKLNEVMRENEILKQILDSHALASHPIFNNHYNPTQGIASMIIDEAPSNKESDNG